MPTRRRLQGSDHNDSQWLFLAAYICFIFCFSCGIYLFMAPTDKYVRNVTMFAEYNTRRSAEPIVLSNTCICHDSGSGVRPYGKYCGIGYGEMNTSIPSCDEIDECCRIHDICVTVSIEGLLSCACNRAFVICLECAYISRILNGTLLAHGGGPWNCPTALKSAAAMSLNVKYLVPWCFVPNSTSVN
jgi:hypothetical protein